MTDGMFCAKCLSLYQEILSKTRLSGTGKYSKLGRTLYYGRNTKYRDLVVVVNFAKGFFFILSRLEPILVIYKRCLNKPSTL